MLLARALAKRALAALRKQRRRQLARRKAKPADFRALFSGNCDDDFCVGIKLTRRSVRLFTGLHGADIIVASPLGLVRRIERGSTPANLKKGPTGKGRQQQQKKTLEQDELDAAAFIDPDVAPIVDQGCAIVLPLLEAAKERQRREANGK